MSTFIHHRFVQQWEFPVDNGSLGTPKAATVAAIPGTGFAPNRVYIADAGEETVGLTGPQIVFLLYCGLSDCAVVYAEVLEGDFATVDVNAVATQVADAIIADPASKLSALAAVRGPGAVDLVTLEAICPLCAGRTQFATGFAFSRNMAWLQ